MIVTSVVVITIAAVFLIACRTAKQFSERRAEGAKANSGLVRVTGYCNCGKCCGWKRTWFGLGEPVYTYGVMKGKPKKVGITASGTVAKRGTIAADPSIYPFGTKLDIPGYGVGTVEDIGGAIKGQHIDLWFPSHTEARRWGSKWLQVRRVN